MLGWPELTLLVASVYAALPPRERGEAVIVANNYGEAGTLELHGAQLGLPHVISTAGSMWFFGPGSGPARCACSGGLAR